MRFSSKVHRCQQSPIRKFHPYAVKAEAAGKRIYHLNIGQPDVKTPVALFDAVRSFSPDVLAYAPSAGIPPMIDAVRKYYEGIGVALDASDILITTGGSEALSMAFACLLDEGDEVIVPEPFYPNYSTFAAAAGGVICPLPTYPEEGYFYADRARVEACINERTKAILITNPGNPTGTVLTPEQQRMLLEIAIENDLFLIADEVYREFVYTDESLSSFGQLGFGDENLILIDSVSKRFSACGARIGCLISKNWELMEHALKLCQARLSVATIDQVAAAALYSVEPEYFGAVRKEYRARRDTVVQKLQEIPGVLCRCPEGAFYLMASLPVDDAEQFQKFLLEEFDDNGDTVMFAAGEPFYATPEKGKNEIRIAYVTCQEDLARAIDLLALGIQAYNRRKELS